MENNNRITHRLTVIMVAGLIVVLSALVAGKVIDVKLANVEKVDERSQTALVADSLVGNSAPRKPDAPAVAQPAPTMCDAVFAACLVYYDEIRDACIQQCMEDWADGGSPPSGGCSQGCNSAYQQGVQACNLIRAICQFM